MCLLLIPLTFFGQFVDPRKNNNILYRIFVASSDPEEYLYDNSVITKIELSDENLLNQIIIENPGVQNDDDEDDEDIEYLNENSECDELQENLTSFPAYKIISWTEKKELYQFEYILEHLCTKNNIDIKEIEQNNVLYHILDDRYLDNSHVPSDKIKIGGTSVFCQYSYDISKFDNFIQLSYCKELPFNWGDNGIAHIYEDEDNNYLLLEYDCY